MENPDDYSVKIANYLEDIMSASEQEAFMEELSNNEMLRHQFEDELLLRNLLHVENETAFLANDLVMQPANEHVSLINKTRVNKSPLNGTTPVVKLFNRYKFIAAAVSVFILGSIITLWVINRNNYFRNIAETYVPKDSIAKIDTSTRNVHPSVVVQPGNKAVSDIDSSEKDIATLLVQHKIADSAFKKFYTPYTGKNDPIEISDFFQAYKQGNYAKVLSAKDADFQSMGSGNREDILKQYMHLYKGLSYLAENKVSQANQQFSQVLNTAGKKDDQFYKAQWYAALTWLKGGNISKASAILKDISDTASPYASKAVKLLNLL